MKGTSQKGVKNRVKEKKKKKTKPVKPSGQQVQVHLSKRKPKIKAHFFRAETELSASNSVRSDRALGEKDNFRFKA